MRRKRSRLPTSISIFYKRPRISDMAINISNVKNRDAVVALEGLAPKRDVRYIDPHGNPVRTQKLLKTDLAHDLTQLMKKRKTTDALAKALVKDDPEINIEEFGMFLVDTS